MARTSTAAGLLEDYVAAVERRLPARMRQDVGRELRSTLQDTLDTRAEEAGREPDLAMARAVLLELGSPDQTAAGYQPPQYLVGPRWMPFFQRTVAVVLAVVVGLAAAGFGMQLSRSPLDGGEALLATGQFLGGLLVSLATAFGFTALVFAIIERVSPPPAAGAWNPDDLAEDAGGGPGRGDAVANLVTSLGALALFNLAPGLVGIWSFGQSGWMVTPIFSGTGAGWLPWLSGIWILQAILAIIVLRSGGWSQVQRAAQLVINGATILILGLMIAGPSIVAPQGGPVPDDALATLVNLGLAGLIVLLAVDSATTVYGMLKRVVPGAPISA